MKNTLDELNYLFENKLYDLNYTCETGNDGIGSYECHGFKGNDIGSDYYCECLSLIFLDLEYQEDDVKIYEDFIGKNSQLLLANIDKFTRGRDPHNKEVDFSKKVTLGKKLLVIDVMWDSMIV